MVDLPVLSVPQAPTVEQLLVLLAERDALIVQLSAVVEELTTRAWRSRGRVCRNGPSPTTGLPGWPSREVSRAICRRSTRRHRPAPYLWSARDIGLLLQTTRSLRPRLRAASHEALFGLLAVSGMRLGEAVGLHRDDVDLESGVITIRHAKFDRTRLVPLHPTATTALHGYAVERDRLCPHPRSEAFLLTSRGTSLNRSDVDRTLRQLTTTMGIRTATIHPRAHDLRHSMVVRTLLGWMHDGASVDQHIGVLSTYLGHVAPADTYWYLSATPELMVLAAERLDLRFGGQR